MNMDKFKDIMSGAYSKAKQFAKGCQEQDKHLAAQRVAAMRQAQTAMQKAALQAEHEAFGNALGRCLEHEFEDCGLKRPRRIEDILCDDANNSIRINGTAAPDFSYEAKRDFSDCGSLSDIMNGRSQRIPATAIEKVLNRALRKYATRRGYDFSRVSVDDIPHGKVRITVHDVDLTPAEKLRRAGYPNYGY